MSRLRRTLAKAATSLWDGMVLDLVLRGQPLPLVQVPVCYPGRAKPRPPLFLSPRSAPRMSLPTPGIQVKLAQLRVPVPRQAKISELSGAYMRTSLVCDRCDPWNICWKLALTPVQFSSIGRIPYEDGSDRPLVCLYCG